MTSFLASWLFDKLAYRQIDLLPVYVLYVFMSVKSRLQRVIFDQYRSHTQSKWKVDHTWYYIVSKNDTDAVQYNFNARQPILVIFGRDVA